MTEVVVVGGGFAGSAAALSLAERGAAVTLLEPEGVGAAATGAAAGMLAPQYEALGPGPLFQLLRSARLHFERFARTLEELAELEAGVRWEGMLVANLTQDEHHEAQSTAAWQTAAGETADLLDPAEAARLQPGLAPTARSFLWLPNEGQVDAQRLPELLSRALARAGVRVLRGARAASVRVVAGAACGVTLDGGRELEADAVVVAAGAWSGKVAGASRRLPLRPVRGHLVRYTAPAVRLNRLVAGHGGRYLVPRSDGSVLAGSTMDEVGFDRSLDEYAIRGIRDAAAELVPALAAARPAERWADLRPVTRDRLPVVGADPAVRGLFYATGYGRNGILLSPLAGVAIADAVHGAEPAEEWASASPSRLPRATPQRASSVAQTVAPVPGRPAVQAAGGASDRR